MWRDRIPQDGYSIDAFGPAAEPAGPTTRLDRLSSCISAALSRLPFPVTGNRNTARTMPGTR
jgi:hypothetical protein